MSNNNAFENWEQWAINDWREFSLFFNRRYGVAAFGKAETEFANQMKISNHVMGQLTNIAIGKGIQYGVSATLSSVLSFGDILAQLGGIGYVASMKELQGYSRYNPHTLWEQGVFSSQWTFAEGHLADYVKFILYWYPKDIAAGRYGFRYGAERDDGACGVLRTTKKFQ